MQIRQFSNFNKIFYVEQYILILAQLDRAQRALSNYAKIKMYCSVLNFRMYKNLKIDKNMQFRQFGIKSMKCKTHQHIVTGTSNYIFACIDPSITYLTYQEMEDPPIQT